MTKAYKKTDGVLTKKYLDKRFRQLEERLDKKFATKDDLKNFATKDDLKNFATKDDLKNFATKDDLKKSIERVLKYIDFKLEPIEEFRKKFDIFQDHINRTLDWIVKKLEKYDQEYTIMSARYPEITDQLEDHETRIASLEKKADYKTS
jgi:hypothetical protein